MPNRPRRSSVAAMDFEVAGFKMGQRVIHPTFGEGLVTNFEGSGNHARIQVEFATEGTKWLVAAYAKLEAV